MDFSKIIIFKKKSLADIFGEIYENSKTKEEQIKELINQLKPMIKQTGDAVILVPLLKEYLEVSVKNDEHLIKMAAIVQRAMSNLQNSDKELLSDREKAELINIAKQIHSN